MTPEEEAVIRAAESTFLKKKYWRHFEISRHMQRELTVLEDAVESMQARRVREEGE